MGRIAVVVVSLAIVVVSCSPAGESDGDISGPWDLVTASGSGVRYPPDPNYDTPWIQVLPEVVGSTGCNRIRGDGPPPDFADGHLAPVPWIAEAVACEGTVAVVEAFMFATLSHEDGAQVTFGDDGETMHWESPTGITLDFVRQ